MIAEFSIKNIVLSVIVILLTLLGGWQAYNNMPRFEDPEFTIRTAKIYTAYPGATPTEVAEEVTEVLERQIQQMQEVETVESISRPGFSELSIDIDYAFSPTKNDLQMIWTKLRNKVSDAEKLLPPGTQKPVVYDEFGDVYGFYYMITGPGYDSREMREYAKELRSSLLQVDGVAKVEFLGVQEEAIYVEISRPAALSLGVSVKNVYDILSAQNAMVPAGDVVIQNRRIVIQPKTQIDSVEKIQNLIVSDNKAGKPVLLKDIAKVWRGYKTPSKKMARFGGKEAIGFGISNIQGGNVVETGQRIDAKLKELEVLKPLGFEIHEFYHQGNIVDASVQNFLVNVVVALIIVIITLFLFMGLQSAIVTGVILLLTIAATLFAMNVSGIPLHRISLGALIIALGMMVDNAIVVVEGILVGVKSGRKKLEIAKEVVGQTQWALLGGTLVGILAFAPIGFAPGKTAEYTGDLFWVIFISLMFSWVFAISLTPLFCYWMFKEVEPSAYQEKAKESLFVRGYKGFLRYAIKGRWLVVVATICLFTVSVFGFRYVKSGFFPASTAPYFIVDYWLPESVDIEKTSSDILQLENYVAKLNGVNAVHSIIGGGALRFMLVYTPESNNSAYGQLLVRIDDYKQFDTLSPQVRDYIEQNFPDAQAKIWKFVMGPGGGSKIEASFSGPDPKLLRQLANKAKGLMRADGEAQSIKDDWREPVAVIEPLYSKVKGARAGVTREDLSLSMMMNFNGLNVGIYREGDELIPILSRAPEYERSNVKDITDIQVMSRTKGQLIPISQVTDGFKTLWRDGQIRREDRIWTIKAQSDPLPGNLASELLGRLMPLIESIELPPGYNLDWDGEYGDSKESKEDLGKTLPYGLLGMILVVFILFGKVRQPLVIWATVPLALIGVVFGLLVIGVPFEFMAILGLLSLSGLLIKNAIVLVDQIDFEIASGKPRLQAILDSAASRMRPVMMGALTTVLGVLPLFADAFFQSMSVVLVFGLSFATVLTLIVVPVLYAIFFNVKAEEV